MFKYILGKVSTLSFDQFSFRTRHTGQSFNETDLDINFLFEFFSFFAENLLSNFFSSVSETFQAHSGGFLKILNRFLGFLQSLIFASQDKNVHTIIRNYFLFIFHQISYYQNLNLTLLDKNPSSDLLYKLEDFLGTQIEGQNFERKLLAVWSLDFEIAVIRRARWEVEVVLEPESRSSQPVDDDQLE